MFQNSVGSAGLEIVLLAEGYSRTGVGPQQFAMDKASLDLELRKIEPFRHLSGRAGGFVRIAHWQSASTDRPFRASYTAASGLLRFNEATVASVFQTVSVPARGTTNLLTALQDPGSAPLRVLAVILLPSAGSRWGEYEHRPTSICPWFVATHMGADAARVVARSLGRVLGLGDEFGARTLAGGLDSEIRRGIMPNRMAIPFGKTVATLAVEDLPVPWQALVPAMGPGTYDGPFEGGGGLGTGVVRFAEHCLMRRRIGATADRDATDNTEFCLVCEHFLSSVLLGAPWAQPEPRQTLENQMLEFDHIVWDEKPPVTVDGTLPAAGPLFFTPPKPYMKWTAKVDPVRGLYVEDVIAEIPKSSQATNDYSQLVCRRIEFRNITVHLAGDEGPVRFDIAAALPTATLEYGYRKTGQGASFADPYWHNGLKLTLDGVVRGGAGRARVRVEMAIVFRGGVADFDPARAGRALKMYPQLGFTPMADASATTEVIACSGDIIFQVQVPMPSAVAESCHGNASIQPGNQNFPSFFTDCNYRFPRPFVNLLRGLRFENALELLPMPESWTMAELAAETRDFFYQWSVSGIAEDFVEVIAAATAIWHGVFDYFRVDIPHEIEIPAVYGPSDPKWKDDKRTADVEWPRQMTRSVYKYPRQGYYDNIHVHGDMGTYGMAPNVMARVMAPVCAHACFHLHWRWAPVNFKIALAVRALDLLPLVLSMAAELRGLELPTAEEWRALVDMLLPLMDDLFLDGVASPYRGWEASLLESEAGMVEGAPLVPPNQTIVVWITNPFIQLVPGGQTDTGLLDDSALPTFPHLDRALQADEKAVWYKARIETPLPIGGRQVVFPHGCGLAYEHEPGVLEQSLRLFLFVRKEDPNYLPWVFQQVSPTQAWVLAPNANAYTISKVFTDAYEMMRFMGPVNLDNQVIPFGMTVAYDPDGTTLEVL